MYNMQYNNLMPQGIADMSQYLDLMTPSNQSQSAFPAEQNPYLQPNPTTPSQWGTTGYQKPPQQQGSTQQPGNPQFQGFPENTGYPQQLGLLQNNQYPQLLGPFQQNGINLQPGLGLSGYGLPGFPFNQPGFNQQAFNQQAFNQQALNQQALMKQAFLQQALMQQGLLQSGSNLSGHSQPGPLQPRQHQRLGPSQQPDNRQQPGNQQQPGHHQQPGHQQPGHAQQFGHQQQAGYSQKPKNSNQSGYGHKRKCSRKSFPKPYSTKSLGHPPPSRLPTPLRQPSPLLQRSAGQTYVAPEPQRVQQQPPVLRSPPSPVNDAAPDSAACITQCPTQAAPVSPSVPAAVSSAEPAADAPDAPGTPGTPASSGALAPDSPEMVDPVSPGSFHGLIDSYSPPFPFPLSPTANNRQQQLGELTLPEPALPVLDARTQAHALLTQANLSHADRLTTAPMARKKTNPAKRQHQSSGGSGNARNTVAPLGGELLELANAQAAVSDTVNAASASNTRNAATASDNINAASASASTSASTSASNAVNAVANSPTFAVDTTTAVANPAMNATSNMPQSNGDDNVDPNIDPNFDFSFDDTLDFAGDNFDFGNVNDFGNGNDVGNDNDFGDGNDVGNDNDFGDGNDIGNGNNFGNNNGNDLANGFNYNANTFGNIFGGRRNAPNLSDNLNLNQARMNAGPSAQLPGRGRKRKASAKRKKPVYKEYMPAVYEKLTATTFANAADAIAFTNVPRWRPKHGEPDLTIPTTLAQKKDRVLELVNSLINMEDIYDNTNTSSNTMPRIMRSESQYTMQQIEARSWQTLEMAISLHVHGCHVWDGPDATAGDNDQDRVLGFAERWDELCELAKRWKTAAQQIMDNTGMASLVCAPIRHQRRKTTNRRANGRKQVTLEAGRQAQKDKLLNGGGADGDDGGDGGFLAGGGLLGGGGGGILGGRAVLGGGQRQFNASAEALAEADALALAEAEALALAEEQRALFGEEEGGEEEESMLASASKRRRLS
ncbi:uncharacterized protein K452DRAFT_317339 [Aplosporella prunicola CBS 121167]|uniref:Uncharacterized protein n=1 Tax=Aplosporella prunicola CBS 121167 TaxID=1176127 RepID=A0A6A6BIT3_9PEZI|nr:uncharacterized protein K452DRAFT_317339 [Aplosporella prunicola CBS 121167]KAF2143926.1 hypothetical protein K452DRAFT_317339 [Aplosporella prunicola CBS 121167]